MKAFIRNFLKSDTVLVTLLIVAVFSIYLLTIKADFVSSVERGRYALTRAIVEQHTFSIDKYKDFSYPDVSFKDGHYYSRFPAGMSVLSIPTALVATSTNILDQKHIHFIIMAYLGAVIVGLLYLLGRLYEFQKGTSLICAFAFAVSTLLFSFAGGYWSHIYSALFITLSLYFFTLFRKQKSKWFLLLLSISYSASISIDFPNGLILSPLMIGVVLSILHSKKKVFSKIWALFVTGIPIALISISIGLYNLTSFGSVVTIGQSAKTSLGTKLEKHIVPLGEWTSKGVFDDRRLFPGLFTQLFSVERGLLFFAPILLLAFAGVGSLYKIDKYLTRILVSIIIINLLFYSVWQDYWGGWSFGPRYLIVSIPALFLPLLSLVQKHIASAFFLFLFLVSTLFGTIINTVGAVAGIVLPCPCEGYVGLAYSPLLAFQTVMNGSINSFFYSSFFHNSMNQLEYTAFVFFLAILFLSAFIYIQSLERK